MLLRICVLGVLDGGRHLGRELRFEMLRHGQ